MKARFVTILKVTDPDTGGEVEIEVWKDPQSEGLFALDASFLDQVSHEVQSPFNPATRLELPAEALESTKGATEDAVRRLKALAEERDAGDNELMLDDLVHDLASREASDANNGGLESQIRFALARMGAKDGEAEVSRIITEFTDYDYKRTHGEDEEAE